MHFISIRESLSSLPQSHGSTQITSRLPIRNLEPRSKPGDMTRLRNMLFATADPGIYFEHLALLPRQREGRGINKTKQLNKLTEVVPVSDFYPAALAGCFAHQ